MPPLPLPLPTAAPAPTGPAVQRLPESQTPAHRTSTRTSRAAFGKDQDEGQGRGGDRGRGGGNGGTKGRSRQGGSGARGADAFDARKLTDGQLDELVHRLIGSLVPRLKIELRLDRERIGRLRDPRR
ncbi:hypothetical protein [Streptomyces pinistramenti]|uniref:hypothetical protein n=1 Tax=Streptomyces pinistramenti TaxID=2884812 RepID=UPI001D07C13C|nr:hypothetical protein [Streptomyces pinistramenti]MCB5909124.1 hypothetical protein [Streptomyces pinistramenti]